MKYIGRRYRSPNSEKFKRNVMLCPAAASRITKPRRTPIPIVIFLFIAGLIAGTFGGRSSSYVICISTNYHSMELYQVYLTIILV
jgi:hypothetical protein